MTQEKFLEKIKKKFSLKNYNTMEVDCVADYFLKAETTEDIIKGISYARERSISFFILGKGSNVIFPSNYNGMIIYLAMDRFSLQEKNQKIVFVADAGLFLPKMAKEIFKKRGRGMDWAGGVPGTVGGAIRGNAGAFDDFMADCVERVEALNTQTLEKQIFKNSECEFDYRESIFKKEKKYVILNARMEFSKKREDDGKFEEYLAYRKKNHPLEPSSGSVFKNPKVGKEFYNRHPELKKFENLGFVPIKFLIEGCNLKGRVMGGAKISEKHPNFIINTGNATGKDIKNLIELVKKEVGEKYAIEVVEEVEIIE